EDNHSGLLKIYPVPARNIITVELPKGSPESSLTVTDLAGRVIYTSGHKDNFFEIDCARWSPGIYNIKVYINGFSETGRIIKR
ncbi:MAG: T9SS type A sorting domain-containing protein, partial [Bacteroidetes bacterium]|nr:T9SS type A sorting domain-containing protein [Bacteroidota bacterium]